MLASVLYDGDFELPLVQEVALSGSGSPQCLGAVFVPPASLSVAPMSEMDGPLNALLPRPYNDLGIPGAEVADLTTLTHGDPNGTDLEKLSALILRNVTGSPFDGTSAVDQAGALLAPAASSAIATLWIGNNNVLGASTSGIVVDGVTLVSEADFQASYSAIIAGIPPGVQLVVANIPDVTVDPVLDDDPAGPGQSRDAPAGHRQRGAGAPARTGRLRLSLHPRAAGPGLRACRRARS